MNISRSVKNALRPLRDIVFTFFGFLYDFQRFCRFGGWRASLNDSAQRNYKAVKVYHCLEKSLSFRDRKQGFGWDAVAKLVRLLSNIKTNEVIGFQEKVSLNVLKKFLEVEKDIEGHYKLEKQSAVNLINQFKSENNEAGGTKMFGIDFLKKGILGNPENFFQTRSSVRDFSSTPVDDAMVCRAISLAQKTPSVCNRQAWHVYHMVNPILIEKALRYQNGNRGFGHTIPCLLIITSDLNAFDTSGERYQHSIDGGMFSMSLVMAFHSIGLSTCCLNWSCSGKNDLRFRRLVDIKREHTVIMMLAVGHPRDEIKVCASERRPLSEVYTRLEE
jgi:nitroreductase